MTPFARISALLNGRALGVVGGGNIGRLVVRDLLNKGFPRDQVLVSIGGSEATRQRLVKTGLQNSQIITDNQTIADKSGVVILATRPQDAGRALDGVCFNQQQTVISMMAGVPMTTLEDITGLANDEGRQPQLLRALTCGHDLIESNNGLISFYPSPPAAIRELYQELGSYTPIPDMDTEDQCDKFFAAVVMPAVMVACSLLKTPHSLDSAARAMARHSAGPLEFLPGLYNWANDAHKPLVDHMNASRLSGEEFLQNMFTKGGITECEVTAILRGASFEEAVDAGYLRCLALQKDAASATTVSPRQLAA